MSRPPVSSPEPYTRYGTPAACTAVTAARPSATSASRSNMQRQRQERGAAAVERGAQRALVLDVGDGDLRARGGERLDGRRIAHDRPHRLALLEQRARGSRPLVAVGPDDRERIDRASLSPAGPAVSCSTASRRWPSVPEGGAAGRTRRATGARGSDPGELECSASAWRKAAQASASRATPASIGLAVAGEDHPQVLVGAGPGLQRGLRQHLHAVARGELREGVGAGPRQPHPQARPAARRLPRPVRAAPRAAAPRPPPAARRASRGGRRRSARCPRRTATRRRPGSAATSRGRRRRGSARGARRCPCPRAPSPRAGRPRRAWTASPTVMIGASGAKAASGAGTSPVIGSSAIVSSSTTCRSSSRASRAIAARRRLGTTVPSGLWCVGTM